MQKNLVIVESPAKAKTIEKFLGKDYKVMSSYGHIRDLKTKEFSIDIEHDYAPQYVIPADKKKLVSELKSEAKSAEQVWLASDEDREGEAISWHLYEVLGLKPENTKRIVFHEITKNAILHAIETPRDININLVNAQQARRVLDRIVGFELSPILWRKVKPALSAGRVQSVAVRLIVEREREINEFVSEAAFRVIANFILPDGTTVLKAELNRRLKDKKEVEAFLESCKNASFTIDDITTKPVKKSPAPPFTTSTLQQEAARKLGYSVSQTMMIAQRLYESGLITYMRTDAVNLSKEAIAACRDVIVRYFGDEYLPKAPKEYKTKSKNAQEAHEAIRPSDVTNTPKKMEAKLDNDAHRLYELIWKRTVACQMNPAVLDKVSIDSTSADGQITLRANGQVIAFDGFLKLYQESFDDEEENDENRILPNVEPGEKETKGEIFTDQHFTAPPPRFTEASLVKKLEELGIGRPSTYATIIAVLQERKYVKVEKLRFIPEERGRIVTAFLENFFHKYVEYDFTAQMEEFLDDISAGEMEWRKLLTGFWAKFIKNIDAVTPLQMSEVIDKIDEVLAKHLFPEREDGSDPRSCPECKTGRLGIKFGKFGAFIGCSNYPECKYTQQLVDTTAEEEAAAANAATRAPNPEDRVLGEMNEQKIYLKKGPYGHYVQLGEDDPKGKVKPRRCSLPKGITPEEITPEQAQILLSLPRQLGNGIEVNIGKFGTYLKQGNKSKSLYGNDTVFSITLERAEELLKGAAEKTPAKVIGTHPESKLEITLNNGRYGPYLKCGKTNYALPKEFKDKEPTLEDAVKIIAAKK